MTDSNDWFHKSINSLSLNGKAERTQEAYRCARAQAYGLFTLRRGAQAAASAASGEATALLGVRLVVCIACGCRSTHRGTVSDAD